MKIMILGLAWLAVACGKGGGDKGGEAAPAAENETETEEESSTEPYTKLILEGEEKPACGTDNSGQLIYVLADETFQYCNKGKWKSIDIAGEDGQDGARITDSIHCYGEIASTAYDFKYNASLMSTGDLYVSASVINPQYETGGSLFYAAAQDGTDTGYISFAHDAQATDNYGWWSMELNRDTLVVTIKYNDTELGGDGVETYVMLPEDCTVNSY